MIILLTEQKVLCVRRLVCLFILAHTKGKYIPYRVVELCRSFGITCIYILGTSSESEGQELGSAESPPIKDVSMSMMTCPVSD